MTEECDGSTCSPFSSLTKVRFGSGHEFPAILRGGSPILRTSVLGGFVSAPETKVAKAGRAGPRLAALGVIFCHYANHTNVMKLQLRLLAALWLGAWTAGNGPLHAAGPAMQPYVIELPGHVLRFSLPVAMARGNRPVKQVTRFDPRDDSFARKDFYKVFSVLHDFNGPFWVGAYGSLKIHVMVQRRRAEFPDDIIHDARRFGRLCAFVDSYHLFAVERMCLCAGLPQWHACCAARVGWLRRSEQSRA